MYPNHSELIVNEILKENLRRAERARLVKEAERARLMKEAQEPHPRNPGVRSRGWGGLFAAPFGLVAPRFGPDHAVQPRVCVEC
jgi:hypothetical protein